MFSMASARHPGYAATLHWCQRRLLQEPSNRRPALASGFGRADRQALVSWIRPQQPFEILDGLYQSIAQLHSGPPCEQFLRQADIGAALSGIILGQRPVSNL